jgi:hypothetical protein
VKPEIDLASRQLMMKCYGDKALEESGTRVDELTAAGDHEGVDTWRRDRRRPSSSSRTTPPPGPLY